MRKDEFPIGALCEVLEVPKSTYYYQRNGRLRPPGERETANAALLAQVEAVFAKHKGRYGSPRIHAELKQQVPCSLGRVKRLMRRAGMYTVSTPRYRPKCELPEVIKTCNLLQDGLELTDINQLWHVDITYIPTAEGWLYLAGVYGGFSKCIVGYALAERMKTDWVIQSLRGAVTKRKPALGLIHQSDCGG